MWIPVAILCLLLIGMMFFAAHLMDKLDGRRHANRRR